MKKIIFSLTLPVILLIPLFIVNAQGAGVPEEIVAVFDRIVKALQWLLGAAAIVAFIIAGIFFITAQGDPEKVKTARQFLIWGIVGVVVGLLAGVLVKFAQYMATGQ